MKDDVIQETGLRLLKLWDALDHDRPLLPLAYTIARNLVADEIRRNRNVDVAEEVDVSSDEFVTERAGLARVELGQVEEGLTSLTEKQRSVVLSDLGMAPRPEMGPDAIKMARMRARRSLLAFLTGASKLHAGVVFNFKRLLRTAEVAAAGRDGWAAGAGAVAAVAMLATWSGPPPGWSPVPHGVGDPLRPQIRVDEGSVATGSLDRGGEPSAAAPQKSAGRTIARSAPAEDSVARPQQRSAPDENPPTIAVGENEARVGAGVRILGGGAQAGDDGQQDVSLCADSDSFYAGPAGDPNCSGTIVSAEAGGDVTTGH